MEKQVTCRTCIHVKQCKYLQMLKDNKEAFEMFCGAVVEFPIDILSLAGKCSEYTSPKMIEDSMNKANGLNA